MIDTEKAGKLVLERLYFASQIDSVVAKRRAAAKHPDCGIDFFFAHVVYARELSGSGSRRTGWPPLIASLLFEAASLGSVSSLISHFLPHLIYAVLRSTVNVRRQLNFLPTRSEAELYRQLSNARIIRAGHDAKTAAIDQTARRRELRVIEDIEKLEAESST